jgi:hypothetical protein
MHQKSVNELQLVTDPEIEAPYLIETGLIVVSSPQHSMLWERSAVILVAHCACRWLLSALEHLEGVKTLSGHIRWEFDRESVCVLWGCWM